MSSYILVADFRTNFKPSSPELTSTVESRYNAVAGVQKAGPRYKWIALWRDDRSTDDGRYIGSIWTRYTRQW